MLYTVIAIAGGGGGGQAGGGDLLTGFIIPMALVFGIMYVLVIRPQQKKQQEHEEYLKALKSGDKVVTQGGLFGRVTAVSERTITLDIGDRTRVKVLRSHVIGSQDAALAGELEGGGGAAKNDEKSKESKDD
ncbi:MAG: preprotein translocase subunit YajC [Myxococcales bacterium]|nr:preprotein translocase subunit YajC [Myxococcales bacterium]